MRVKAFFNYTPAPKEVHNGKDMTQPNLSYTIRELLQRSTTGFFPDVKREPVFTGPTDDPALMHGTDLDLSEMANIMNYGNELSESIKNKLKEKEKLQKEIKEQKDEKPILEDPAV